MMDRSLTPGLISETALGPGDPAHFTGRVRMGLLAGSADATLHLYEVRFDSGARTRWHSHSGEQVLLCLQGRCVVQSRGSLPRVLEEKVAARIPAGVIHWHGALREPACHLAVNIATTTSWLDEVSEADYERALAQVDA